MLPWAYVTPGQVKGGLENIGEVGVREGVMNVPGDTGKD